MPSQHQGIFNDTIPDKANDGSKGQHSKSTLQEAFPASPVHAAVDGSYQMYDVGDGSQLGVPWGSDLGMRVFYRDEVMNGTKTIAGGYWPDGVSLDYDDAPDLTDARNNAADQTIVSEGIGPIVTTMDIDSPSNPAAGLPENKPSEIGTPTSPSTTSTQIGGGNTPPSIYGILGESSAHNS